jgi:hypothetical protein
MLSDCIQPIWINRQLNLKTPLGKCPVGVDQKKWLSLMKKAAAFIKISLSLCARQSCFPTLESVVALASLSFYRKGYSLPILVYIVIFRGSQPERLRLIYPALVYWYSLLPQSIWLILIVALG